MRNQNSFFFKKKIIDNLFKADPVINFQVTSGPEIIAFTAYIFATYTKKKDSLKMLENQK